MLFRKWSCLQSWCLFAVDVEWNGTNEITLLVKKGCSYLWSKLIMTKELVSFCLWYHSFEATAINVIHFCIMCNLFPGFLTLGLSGLFPNSWSCIFVTDEKQFCPEHLQICGLKLSWKTDTKCEWTIFTSNHSVFSLLPANKQNA